MYAVIRSGGKQYRVQAGDKIRIELVEKNPGDIFDTTEVLMVGGEKVHIGQPIVSNAKVTLEVTRTVKAPKILVFKKKRRQGYRKMQGHRQQYTEVVVQAITSPEGKTVRAGAKQE